MNAFFGLLRFVHHLPLSAIDAIRHYGTAARLLWPRLDRHHRRRIPGEPQGRPRGVIFNAAEFLDAGVVFATLIDIGVIGVVFERFVFQTLERVTVRRRGVVTSGPRKMRFPRRDMLITAHGRLPNSLKGGIG